MSVEINVALDERGEQHAGLEKVWARWAIADLSDRMNGNPSEQLQSQITKLSLQHSLLSAYTAFVAVDDAQRTGGDHGVTVAVPVPVPEGVRYETTVQTR